MFFSKRPQIGCKSRSSRSWSISQWMTALSLSDSLIRLFFSFVFFFFIRTITIYIILRGGTSENNRDWKTTGPEQCVSNWWIVRHRPTHRCLTYLTAKGRNCRVCKSLAATWKQRDSEETWRSWTSAMYTVCQLFFFIVLCLPSCVFVYFTCSQVSIMERRLCGSSSGEDRSVTSTPWERENEYIACANTLALILSWFPSVPFSSASPCVYHLYMQHYQMTPSNRST